MPNTQLRVRLARVVVPLGEPGHEVPKQPSPEAPAIPTGNIIRLRIPVALLERRLQRNKSRTKLNLSRRGNAVSQFTLPLIRVVMPLELKRKHR
jgi:hypothetical protein